MKTASIRYRDIKGEQATVWFTFIQVQGIGGPPINALYYKLMGEPTPINLGEGIVDEKGHLINFSSLEEALTFGEKYVAKKHGITPAL